MAEDKKQFRRRDYCFTINNHTDEDTQLLKKLELDPKLRYLIYGEEVGENGTPHLQGYVYFHNAIGFSSLKKHLPRAHLEVCKGTPEQNIAYCSKDGLTYEYGDAPISKKRQGERGKEFWDEQLSLAKKGRLEDIDSKILISHFNSLNSIASRYAPMPLDLDDPTEALWYYGPTGTGKSKKAREDNPGYYLKACNKWWDGYLGEETVIIDDFDKQHHMLGHHLKIWADRYAFPAEVKGSKVNLRPKKIIVTSNWHPTEIWQDTQTIEPICRRFQVVQFFNGLVPSV